MSLETPSRVASQVRSMHTMRAPLNAAFMATMLLGGAAYSLWDWTGTCAFGAISAALAFVAVALTMIAMR